MFVGETGIGRIIERTVQLMKQDPNEDVSKHGAIPLDMIQRGINLWFSLASDLFGGEISSNAASYFAAGLKGRAYEMKKYQDHRALEGAISIDVPKDGRLIPEQIPLRNAMNELLREEFRTDDQRGVDRWNKTLEQEGIDFRFSLPDRKFHRQVGVYADHRFDPTGRLIDGATWEAKKSEWLLGPKDIEYLKTIQHPVREPGRFAQWIAPPRQGIKGRPVEFQYVRI